MLFPEGSQSSLRGIYVYDKNREAGQEVYKDFIKCKPMKFTVRILEGNSSELYQVVGHLVFS